MKNLTISLLLILSLVACNNSGSSTDTSDTTTINTTTETPTDGGPNHGLGDTTSYNRSNDTLSKDSVPKK